MKKLYLSPALTVVRVKAERGFSDSLLVPVDLSELLLWDEAESHQKHVEDYEVVNDWNEGSDGFWL